MKRFSIRFFVQLSALSIFIFFNSFATQAQTVFKKANELQGISIGSVAPVFQAIDQFDSTFTLTRALENGPIVLVFYRGQWCPYYNKHLSNLQDSLDQITEKGARIIAISPEKPEYLQKISDKTGAIFTLLYDQDYLISKAYGVLFQPEKSTRLLYNTVLGANLKVAHDNDQELLPIPATYIIDRDGTVIWRHFDSNYKERSTVKDILDNLPQL